MLTFDDQPREQLRQIFFDAFDKFEQRQPTISPLEQQVIAVIEMHPEYHAILRNQERYLHQDFLVEAGQVNPFLHMSGHLGLREQLNTNRPAGIQSLYKSLLARYDNAHALEHDMMECLMSVMWQAHRDGTIPDDHTYLQHLHQQLKPTD